MKLVAAPLLVRICRLALSPELSQLPIFIIDRLRTPRTIYDRITKRAAVWSSNLAPVVESLITVVMTCGTRRKRTSFRTKLHALMLCVTINTTDPGRRVRLDHRRFKRIRLVA